MTIMVDITTPLEGLNAEETDIAYKILKQLADSGESQLLKGLYAQDYNEIPVSIDQFLEDDRYLGKVFDHGNNIYPYWRKFLHKLFHENYDNAFEICLTGSIGQGKSTISAIALMYHLYQVLCLKDPQKFYGLTGNAPIVFVCLNLTLDLAYSGLYSMITSAIQMSPWFMEKCDVHGKYNYTVEFPNNIELMCASTAQHVIGKNVKCVLMDEINFNNAPKGSKRSVMDTYRAVRRRVESRFMRAGKVNGYIFLISSKNSEQDFLDKYIQTLKGSKSTLVVDEPIWNVKPPETYLGTKFKVAVGDKTKDSYIMSPKESDDIVLEKGYQILEVPTEYRTAFEQDINDALKDIAGISSVSTNKLIPYPAKIQSVINRDRKSPFMVDQIILDLDSEDEIKDFLDDIRILKKDIHIPRFLHCDLGLKNDQTGLSMVHSDTRTSVDRYTKDGKILSLIEQHYTQDFTIGIKASAGSEVPIYKIRNFIIWLATSLGLHIQTVSFDGYQSSDSLQLLKIAGINTKLTSVDRTPDPYLNLKSCILENRLDLYEHSTLIREIYEVEYDKRTGKVDHPPEELGGSKDLADSLCGALWDAQEYYVTQAPKAPGVVQHDNVKQAVKFINEFNKKRWVPNNAQDLAEDKWLTSDYKF